ncbi:MAG TPA: UDP-N-acetylmuramoyl-L-alanine--D-glutamate ligase [Treponema sp.]|nr:UDP-N-acetylmuramoyl-L-alanine--D-glutamate ligase [Treponema sp.]
MNETKRSIPLNFNNPPFTSLSDLAGLRVTVMGLGLNGGGLASARFFAQHGAKVTVTDMKTAQELAPSIKSLEDYPSIRFVLGTHEIGDFTQADMVIKNPGVKLAGNIYLEKARSIETDITVFLRLCSAPILAVTGSKGKSSTVSALYFAMKELGFPVFLGGNITVSPLSFLHQVSENTPVILELSSWQLADLKDRNLLKPTIALITPIMSDHQNWYGNMETYVADKKLIYANMDHSTHLLCNADDGWGTTFASETQARVHWYTNRESGGTTKNDSITPRKRDGAWITPDGRGMMRTENSEVEILPATLSVPGAHMRQNLLNAAQMMVLYGANPAKTGAALASFTGTEHRLELFKEDAGIRYYNDSAATIPEAAAAAANAFDQPVLLLAGGTDKNLEFTPLAEAARNVKRLLLLSGTGTEKLIPLLKERNIAFDGPYPSIAALVAATKKIAQPGDIVVFSPGATSFGMFKNEFDRGNQFKAAF